MLRDTLQMEIPGRKPSPDTEQPVRQADLGNRAWWCVVKCGPSTHCLRVVYQTSEFQNVSGAWLGPCEEISTFCQTGSEEQVVNHRVGAFSRLCLFYKSRTTHITNLYTSLSAAPHDSYFQLIPA